MTRILAALRDILSSDAAGRRASVYAVAATQWGHVWIGYATAEMILRSGGPLWIALVVTMLVWAGLWEAQQYLSDGGRHRVRRRYDWAADGACYGLGAAGAILSSEPWRWAIFVVVSLILAGSLGMIFGREARNPGGSQ